MDERNTDDVPVNAFLVEYYEYFQTHQKILEFDRKKRCLGRPLCQTSDRERLVNLADNVV